MAESSFHPDFPKGTRVINNRRESAYYGQRGEVYGGRPNSSGTCTLVLVRWDKTEEALAYVANRLTIAPKSESEYKVSSRKTGPRQVTIHEIPAQAKRGRPTIFKLHENKTS